MPMRGAEARGGGNAEGEGAGERIGEDGLHLRAGGRQRGADDDRHHGDGHADVPDDGADLIGDGSGIEQREDDLIEPVVRRTPGEIDGEGQAEGDRHRGKDDELAAGEGAVLTAPPICGQRERCWVAGGHDQLPSSESQ